MNPVILMRSSLAERGEKDAAAGFFDVFDRRSEVPANSLVVGRYSVLPYYKELHLDLSATGSRLINTPSQHAYIADLQNYVADLREMTFDTWDQLYLIPNHGAFVLKGATNSKKQQWRTHMFAADKRAAGEVYDRLCEDGLVGEQKIYIRRFEPLYTYYNDIVGCPVTREWRFFILNGQVLCGGFYWANHAKEVAKREGRMLDGSEVPREWLEEAIRRIGNQAAFYVMDVAQTATGEFRVVELNDGQMSGLSCIDPGEFYRQLWEAL